MDSNIAEPLFEIETNYPGLQNTRYRGYHVWAIVRFLLRIQLANPPKQKDTSFKSLLSRIKWGSIRSTSFVKEIITEKRKWFARYDVVVFSNRFEKRLVQGQMIDKLTSGIIENCEASGLKVLVVNYGDPENKENIKFRSTHMIDGRKLYYFLGSIPSFYTKAKRKALVKQLKSSGPATDYDQLAEELDLYIWGIKLFQRLYKIWQPRIVFMPDYSGFAEVYSANVSGIRTVEIQHGNINSFHPGYVTSLSIDRNFYASNLLVFGEHSLLNVNNSIYKTNEVHIVGNYYLEKILQQPLRAELQQLIRSYRLSVCIPYDVTDEKFIFEFIKSIVAVSYDVIFIFSIRYEIPARLKELKDSFSNVHIETRLPFQEIVRCCNFNTCSFSTCALEAPSLGKPNILIATDPRTKVYFENKLDHKHTFFASTPEEYLAVLNNASIQHIPGDEIRHGNSKNIATGYKKNLEHFFSTINF